MNTFISDTVTARNQKAAKEKEKKLLLKHESGKLQSACLNEINQVNDGWRLEINDLNAKQFKMLLHWLQKSHAEYNRSGFLKVNCVLIPYGQSFSGVT